jgi:hypothetical protein
MNDRELLELAAKACQYKYMNSALWDGRDVVEYGWNPLEDDGQALRLAVKLGLDVCIDTKIEREPCTHVIGFRSDLGSGTLDAIENHGDPYAATRRAIVRAAAEIGKEMK